jgi:hypothetical protein
MTQLDSENLEEVETVPGDELGVFPNASTEAVESLVRTKAAKRRCNRRPVKRAAVVTHRWLSFGLAWSC